MALKQRDFYQLYIYNVDDAWNYMKRYFDCLVACKHISRRKNYLLNLLNLLIIGSKFHSKKRFIFVADHFAPSIIWLSIFSGLFDLLPGHLTNYMQEPNHDYPDLKKRLCIPKIKILLILVSFSSFFFYCVDTLGFSVIIIRSNHILFCMVGSAFRRCDNIWVGFTGVKMFSFPPIL